jgi:hypothetical protein
MGMSGYPVVEAEKHGRQMARQRYGTPQYEDGAPNPPDEARPQALGDPRTNARPSGYRNDTRESWLTGKSENATSKPGYVKSKR